MAESSDSNNVPEGTTFVFSSWACTANGSGGFSSHFVTPNSPELKTINQPAKIYEVAELGGKRALLELSSDTAENVSTRTRILGSVEFDTTMTTPTVTFVM